MLGLQDKEYTDRLAILGLKSLQLCCLKATLIVFGLININNYDLLIMKKQPVT